MIKSGDVVCNKYYPNIIRRVMLPNSEGYGSVHTNGHLDRDTCSNPNYWEKTSKLKWWVAAIRWYLQNLFWYLTYKINKDLGIAACSVDFYNGSREVFVHDLFINLYKNPRYFIYRFKLMFGLLTE